VIIASLRLVVPENHTEEVEQVFQLLAGPTRAEPGCLKCWYYRDLENDSTFALFQSWNSEQSMHHYLKSDLYKKVLTLMDMVSEPPEISFYTCTSRKGMEVIKKARRWA